MYGFEYLCSIFKFENIRLPIFFKRNILNLVNRKNLFNFVKQSKSSFNKEENDARRFFDFLPNR